MERCWGFGEFTSERRYRQVHERLQPPRPASIAQNVSEITITTRRDTRSMPLARRGRDRLTQVMTLQSIGKAEEVLEDRRAG